MLYKMRTNTPVPRTKFPASSLQSDGPAPQSASLSNPSGMEKHASQGITPFGMVCSIAACFILLGALGTSAMWLKGECMSGFTRIQKVITLGPVMFGGVRSYFKAEHRYSKVLIMTALTSTLVATPAWLIHDLFTESTLGFLLLSPLYPLFYIAYTALPDLIVAVIAYFMQKILC